GFVWFGTESGLNRYNGYSIQVYRHGVRDSTTISNSQVIRIAEDPHGRIWINQTDIYNYAEDRFTRNTGSYLKGYGIAPGLIKDIVKGSGERYWFLHTTEGLYRYENELGSTVQFKNNPKTRKRLQLIACRHWWT